MSFYGPHQSDIIFNEDLLDKMLDISKKSGFLDKHIVDKNSGQSLLSNKIYTLSNQEKLSNLFNMYYFYSEDRVKRDNDRFRRIKEMIENDTDLTRLFLSEKYNINEDIKKVCTLLSLSILYYYMKNEFITVIIQLLKKYQ
jgi:hypothetical protein